MKTVAVTVLAVVAVVGLAFGIAFATMHTPATRGQTITQCAASGGVVVRSTDGTMYCGR